MKPNCFERCPKQYPEIRDIIDRCIRVRREERSTVKQLLADDFFAQSEDQFGIRIDIKNRENDLSNEALNEIQMQLWWVQWACLIQCHPYKVPVQCV